MVPGRVEGPVGSEKRSVPTSERESRDHGRPIGTLCVVGIFGSLVALGWLALYLGLFLRRVAP